MLVYFNKQMMCYEGSKDLLDCADWTWSQDEADDYGCYHDYDAAVSCKSSKYRVVH